MSLQKRDHLTKLKLRSHRHLDKLKVKLTLTSPQVCLHLIANSSTLIEQTAAILLKVNKTRCS